MLTRRAARHRISDKCQSKWYARAAVRGVSAVSHGFVLIARDREAFYSKL